MFINSANTALEVVGFKLLTLQAAASVRTHHSPVFVSNSSTRQGFNYA